jgi:peptide/nickel transport system permease protein
MTGDPRYLYAQQGGYGITEEQWAALGKELHLDKPLIVQYFYWFKDVARGNLGRSLVDRKPVAEYLAQRYPNTIRLGLVAWVFATVVGIPLGILSAIKRGAWGDYVGRGTALLGQAVPVFWLGIMGILIMSVKFRLLPAGTMGDGFSPKNYVMPAFVLGILPLAGYCRLTRSAMLEVLDSEYVKYARAKGVRETLVVWKHAFRNALIAPLTFSAMQIAWLVSGAVVTETVFTWPGVGRLAVEAVWVNNFPMICGVVLTISATVVIMNFLADIAYAYVDPRIRYG